MTEQGGGRRRSVFRLAMGGLIVCLGSLATGWAAVSEISLDRIWAGDDATTRPIEPEIGGLPAQDAGSPQPTFIDSPVVLPSGARPIEVREIPAAVHPDRALLLWMLSPEVHPAASEVDEYTCPDVTRGSYLSGPTRVSLVDTRGNRVLSTVKIRTDFMSDVDGFDIDTFDVPFDIAPYYYPVQLDRGAASGRPTLMTLRDLNGDGKALEFALFSAENCMYLPTALVGYSDRRDAVVRYSIELTTREDGRFASRDRLVWVDHLFAQKPDPSGVWRYSLDYRGRGGSAETYRIRYDAANERFVGTYEITSDEKLKREGRWQDAVYCDESAFVMRRPWFMDTEGTERP